MNLKFSIYNYFIIILLLILVLIIFYKLYINVDRVTYIKSNFDGNHYYVQDKTNDNIKNEAANYLAKIKLFVNTIVNYMYKNNLPNKDISSRLYKRWSKCLLREMGENEDSVAYTLNKGDEMRICIRHNNKFENINITYFVILHELAHLMSISYDHTDEFRENFNYIVHLASNLGLYYPEDFSKKPVYYCGTKINTTPCSNGTCIFNKKS